MQKPKISIILPAYNAEAYLGEAISSVLRQSYQNWELVVIDDGSSDYTWKQALSFEDPRIQCLRQSNKGVSSARNRGLKVMTGDYFTFLDADDALPPNGLNHMVVAATSCPEVNIFSGRVLVFDASWHTLVREWRPDFHGDPLRPLVRLNERVFFGVCLLVKREKKAEYAFDESLSHCEDLLFFIKLASQKELIYKSRPEVFYHQRRRLNSAMSDLKGLERGYRKLFREVWELDCERLGLFDKLYLKVRYVRIMLLSYLRAKQIRPAFKMLQDLMFLR